MKGEGERGERKESREQKERKNSPPSLSAGLTSKGNQATEDLASSLTSLALNLETSQR